MEITKQSDGKYYEKITTWKKRKNDRIAFTFAMSFIGMFMGFVLGVISMMEHVNPKALEYFFGGIPLLIIISMILIFFESHEKKVKFRRIGK